MVSWWSVGITTFCIFSIPGNTTALCIVGVAFVLGNYLFTWRLGQDSDNESRLDQKEELVWLVSGIPTFFLCAPLVLLREGPVLQGTI